MRGHGATAVGRDVRQAVFHAVYTEMNAQVQAQALAIGTPTSVSHPGRGAGGRGDQRRPDPRAGTAQTSRRRARVMVW